MPDPRNPPPHVYGTGFDRAAHLRADEAWQAEALRDPTTRIALLDGVRVLIATTKDGPRALLANPSALAPLPEDVLPLFLGRIDGRARFAMDMGGRPLAAMGLDRGAFVELRSVGGSLPPLEAALLAFARGLAHWHVRHRHCGACGALTTPAQAGHVRHCDACGLDVFPRTDPAVIVLVTYGERCLLGRSPRFLPGMYSTLAGFVEPGEGLEACVRREIFEEAGVEVNAIAYQSSQPWPFPQSLMLGFRAEAASDALAIDRDELEDARWLTREELRHGVVRLPNPDSIARYLVEGWLAEG